MALAALSGWAFAADKSKGPLKVAIFSVNGASPTIHTMIESATAAAKARGWLARWPALAAALLVALLAAGGYAWRSGLASRMFGVSVAEDKLATAFTRGVIAAHLTAARNLNFVTKRKSVSDSAPMAGDRARLVY